MGTKVIGQRVACWMSVMIAIGQLEILVVVVQVMIGQRNACRLSRMIAIRHCEEIYSGDLKGRKL